MTVPAIGRREQNKLEKRSRIVAAARALFTHKGFQATTSAEIAVAARVASGTVFTYARTKDDLLIMVFHEEIVELSERAYRAAIRETGLLEQAVAFFDTIVAHHERDLPLARALMRQLGYVDSPEQRELVEEITLTTLRLLGQLVDAAQAQGEVAAGLSVTAGARSLFAIFYYHLGAFLSGYLDRSQFDRVLRTDLRLLLEGFR
ncbi:MAG: TetR/AcrR family transcriptional regulator [Phenylobacterium sp.]|nr:MAG: TetR/AcrR family transcriptional regulator [Phenylobacterium sp.]